MNDKSYPTGNLLLQRLDHKDRALLQPHCRRVALKAGMALQRAGAPISHLFFIESGIASLALTGKRLEVALIGREGVVGIPAILGGDLSPSEAVMKIAGQAVMMEAEPLRRAMEGRPALRALLLRYTEVLLTQTSESAFSYADATLLERTARWILMTSDRLQTAEIPVTHEFVASALGARRASVTSAFHFLEGDHIVQAKRGRIRIIDPEGLKAKAGPAYGRAEEEYERLIGTKKSGNDDH